MKLVVVESPYLGDVERNIEYGRTALADCFQRGEAPYASHLLYTQEGVLDDDVPEERELGMEAGFKWGEEADKRVVYTDFGITPGMQEGIDRAEELDQEVEYRNLEGYGS